MARLKLTPEMAKLKGADKKNPKRYKNPPPRSPYGLGDPPKYLSADAQAIWAEIEQEAPPGCITRSERKMMEMLCQEYAAYREHQRHPKRGVFALGRSDQLIKMLGRLGMSPQDRQRLGVTKSDKPSNADDFSDFD